MPIVSSQIFTNNPNGIGRISVTEKHTDHLGIEHFIRYRVNTGFDVDAALSQRAVELNKSLSDKEISSGLDDVKEGVNPLTKSNNLKYAVRDNFVKQLVLEMISSTDIDFIVKCKNLVVDFLLKQTDLEIQTLLGISQIKIDQLRARADAVYLDKTPQKTFEENYLAIKSSRVEVDI